MGVGEVEVALGLRRLGDLVPACTMPTGTVEPGCLLSTVACPVIAGPSREPLHIFGSDTVAVSRRSLQSSRLV